MHFLDVSVFSVGLARLRYFVPRMSCCLRVVYRFRTFLFITFLSFASGNYNCVLLGSLLRDDVGASSGDFVCVYSIRLLER